jgi:hypothetical protein
MVAVIHGRWERMGNVPGERCVRSLDPARWGDQMCVRYDAATLPPSRLQPSAFPRVTGRGGMDGWTEAGAQASPHTVAPSVRSVLAWPLPAIRLDGHWRTRSRSEASSVGAQITEYIHFHPFGRPYDLDD